MLSILDLSNELIDGIIRAVPPCDLQSLALSSKAIYALSKKALERHLMLKKKYSTLNFNFTGHDSDLHDRVPDDTHNPLLLLGSIIEDPDILHYPTSMYLGCCVDESHSSWDPAYEHSDRMDYSRNQSVMEKHSDTLKGMVGKCDFIPDEIKDDASSAICKPNCKGAAVELLVTMLPNLTIIVTQSWTLVDAITWLPSVVQNIAKANQDPKSSCYGKALTRLEEFSINPKGLEYFQGVDGYDSVALLPSMRILRGIGIVGESFTWPSDFRLGSSSITEIDLTHSSIDAYAVESLLSGISALKKFTYNHAGTINGFPAYNPTGYVNALRRYAASSLQSLDISPDKDEEVLEDGEERLCIGSLVGFSSLERIRIEDLALQKLEMYDESSETGLYRDDPEILMERLVDVLPTSVNFLTLIAFMKNEDIQRLLQGLAEEKAEKLPNLKSIRFEGDDPLDDDMKAALKEAGLTLKSWDTTL